jgi:Spy/CpxP family protein refolding chaperone
MPKRLLTLAALSAISLAPLAAQGTTTTTTTPPGIERRVAYLTTLLGLSTSQAAQATTIFTNAQTAAAALRTNMQQARQALRTAITGNDATGIEKAAAAIGNLMGQQTAIQAKADAGFYALLTPDQQTKYNQSGGRGGFGMGRGMGMGGPLGPGPMMRGRMNR